MTFRQTQKLLLSTISEIIWLLNFCFKTNHHHRHMQDSARDGGWKREGRNRREGGREGRETLDERSAAIWGLAEPHTVREAQHRHLHPRLRCPISGDSELFGGFSGGVAHLRWAWHGVEGAQHLSGSPTSTPEQGEALHHRGDRNGGVPLGNDSLTSPRGGADRRQQQRLVQDAPVPGHRPEQEAIGGATQESEKILDFGSISQGGECASTASKKNA